MGVRPIGETPVSEPVRNKSRNPIPASEPFDLDKEIQLNEADDRRMFMEALEHANPPDKDTPPDEYQQQRFRKLKSIKNKQISLDDQIDLHGKSVDEGLLELGRFITRSFANNLRTVVIITGKGKHSPGGVSVLKRNVENWIIAYGRRFIHSYADAPRAYGGRGAFIVYLKDR